MLALGNADNIADTNESRNVFMVAKCLIYKLKGKNMQ